MNYLEEINELIDFTFNNPNNELKRIDMGIVPKELAEKIKTVSDLDTENFLVSIDNYAILHIFNRHSPENEQDSQLIGVMKEDFVYLPTIIFEADNIEYRGTSWRTGQSLLIFSKIIQNRYEVVLEIRAVRKKGKKSRLAVTTFYIKRKK